LQTFLGLGTGSGALYNTRGGAKIARNWEKKSGWVTAGKLPKAPLPALADACRPRT